MPATVERPVFVEDQILTPDDLNALIGYARTQLARHVRSAHTWGIVEGLGLRVEAGNLVVEPGWAVDSAGAALVVARKRLVSVTDFQKNLSRNEKDGPYPVFLVAPAGRRGSRPLTDDRCGVRRGNTADETPDVRFGRIAELADWLPQTAPDLARGPDPDPSAPEPPRKVLLGFVELKNNKFEKVAVDPLETPARPVYAGVIAGEVRAASNLLTLRSRPAGATDAPMLLLGRTKIGTDEYTLIFGTDDGTGQINNKWQLRIKADGTVETNGAVNPNNPLRAGETRVQSGTITDGLRVPLPKDVKEEHLTTGKVRVHVHLTPRPDLSRNPAAPAGTLGTPYICRVDSDLRVECVFAWFRPATAGATYLPGVCDYTIIVGGAAN